MNTADMFPEPSTQTVVAPGQRVRFKFPWPPTVNSYWGKVSPRGTNIVRVYLTDEARAYRKNVEAIVRQHYGGGLPKPIDRDVILDILLHPPDARARDGDNYNKGLWDAMKAAQLFVDDVLVHSYRVTKAPAVRGGLVIVDLWERSSVEAKG